MNTQKVWFITGASKGMGLETAKLVLANGDKLAKRLDEAYYLIKHKKQKPADFIWIWDLKTRLIFMLPSSKSLT